MQNVMGGIFSSLKWALWGSSEPVDDSYIEDVVATVDDISNGEMKEYPLGDGKILLVKNNEGELSAIGNKCTHYNAPLKSGTLCGNRVRCPWHGACFNTKTGDIEDFPGLDSLPVYDVRVEGENIIVRAKKDLIKNSRRTKTMCKFENDERVFVIIGAGAAGTTCAETLRQLQFKGRIILIGKEKSLPYDRPKLSKSLSVDVEKIALRNSQFFEDYDIELKLGYEVTELNPDTKEITLMNGEVIKYDSCLICTGGTPRSLPIEGMNSSNVILLRDHDEAKKIDAEYTGKDVVIIGSSFIGMETAAALVKDAKSINVIGMEEVPFERVLGYEIGASLKKLHESNGVKFHMKRVVNKINTNENGEAISVVMDNGEELPCDLIVVGAGVVPTTAFVSSDDIKDPRDKSLLCDKNMRVADGLYAAGDIARFPLPFLDNKLVRVEHWGMAMYQGNVAAHGMLGLEKSIDSVPFFWTQMYGKSIRYCGHAIEYDTVLIDKEENGLEPQTMKFVAYYGNKDKVVGVCSMGRDPIVSCAAELMHINKMPTISQLKEAIKNSGNTDDLLKSLL